MSDLLGKLENELHGLGLLTATHPIELTLYFVALATFAIAFVLFVRRQQLLPAYWSVVAVLVVEFLFSFGEDTPHHVFRIMGLAQQLRSGSFSLLLSNPATGAAYPVFVYYSFVPYIVPALLAAVGIAPLIAFKLTTAAQLLLFAAGLQAVFRSPESRDYTGVAVFSLSTLLITATCVDGLWWTRAALGEIWVYSLAPWVVSAMLSPRAGGRLFLLLFLQVCSHPIIFAQSLLGEVLLAVGLTTAPVRTIALRALMPVILATAAGALFYAPQLLWMHAVTGNAAIPIQFADTFLTVRDFLDPLHRRNIGLCLPLAVLITVVAGRKRLSPRAWMLIIAFAALLAFQSTRARGVSLHIPLIDLQQFVWRTMLAAALAGIAALAAGWQALPAKAIRAIYLLAVISPFFLLSVHFEELPDMIPLQARVAFDPGGYSRYLRPSDSWGVGPFMPDYSRLTQKCEVAQNAEFHSYQDLRIGIHATSEWVAVESAPIGFVDYRVNGVSRNPYYCDSKLLLGPLPANAFLTVSESQIDRLLQLRMLTLILVLAGALVYLHTRPGAQPTAHA